MKVYELTYPEKVHEHPIPETIAAIGFFDGIHLGHQKVINTAITKAKEENKENAVITFHPHPSVVLSKTKKTVQYITSIPEKLRILEELGVDRVYMITFNQELSQLSPEQFLRHFVTSLNIVHLVAGFDFTFGFKGAGNMHNIKKYAPNPLSYTIIEKMEKNNEKISSTKIRNLLAEGNVNQVNELLGRPFSTIGTVVKGDQRGRTIGFPTANISTSEHTILPKQGVYAVKAIYDGITYEGMANLGVVPTFTDKVTPSLEVYIFDFDEDIYGKQLTVEWYKKIRDEKKFHGIDEIVAQLKEDEKVVRAFFTN